MTTYADMVEAKRRAVEESERLRAYTPRPPRNLTPPITGYRFMLDCPRCGGTLHHITASAPARAANVTSMAIAACPRCRDRWRITVSAVSMKVEEARLAKADQSLTHHINQAQLALAQPAPAGPRKPGPKPRPIRHGGSYGATAHRKRGERPCDECRATERAANAARRARTRAG